MKQKTINTLRWIALPFGIIIGFFLINGLAPYILKFILYMFGWNIDNWFYYGVESFITGVIMAPSVAIISEWIAPNHKGITGLYSALVISIFVLLLILILLGLKIGMWGGVQQLNYLGNISSHPIFDGIASVTTMIIKMVSIIVGMVWVHKNTNHYD